MTSSRSSTSTSKWLAVFAASLVCLGMWVGLADAGGRKRIVVLDFDGPKGDKFHDDVVKLLKKSHTVVATDKWNGAAEELDAAKITEKNVKKVAKKLKIDGVVTGKIEKRRDEYIIQIKLRAGTTGELVGNRIDTKAEEARLDGKAQRDIKEELGGAIDELAANHGGGGDDDEDDGKASGKKKKGDDEEGDDEDKPKHSGFSKKDDDMKGGDKVAADKKKKGTKKDDEEGDEDKPKKDDKKTAKKDDDEPKKDDKKAKKDKKDDDTAAALSTKKDKDKDEGDEDRPKKHKGDDEGDEGGGKKKKVAKKGDDEDGGEAEAEGDGEEEPVPAEALSPGNRAIDAVVGMSFVARRLSFTSDADLATPPPSYKQAIPVAGAMLDATFYPMAFGHKRQGPITGLGIHVLYDQVLKINSQKKYMDQMGNTQTADLTTSEKRFGVGAVFRYPLGPAFVVGGRLEYGSQDFSVNQTLPNMMPTDIPNVKYSMIEIGALARYTLNSKLTLDVDLGFLAVTSAGDIVTEQQYGPGSASGFQGQVGFDYMLTKNIFVRAGARIESISITFKGDPNSMANNRDSDMAQDVQGAKDLYFGGFGTIGYAY